MRRRAARYMVSAPCPACKGKRLRREALSVTFGGSDIAELSAMPMTRLAECSARSRRSARSGRAGAPYRRRAGRPPAEPSNDGFSGQLSA